MQRRKINDLAFSGSSCSFFLHKQIKMLENLVKQKQTFFGVKNIANFEISLTLMNKVFFQ
jgi:hypothetical protein